MFEIQGKYTKAKVMIDSVDPETIKQIHRMVSHPAATNPVAIMPDCHAGKGCVIGFTMKAGPKVVPNWVGVDVGCSVSSYRLPIKSLSTQELTEIDRGIRQVIPMGMSVNTTVDNGLKMSFLAFLRESACASPSPDAKVYSSDVSRRVDDAINAVGMKDGRFWTSLGTLGGGNHFQEIGQDEEGCLWLTLHTGSRNFGKRVCEYFDAAAQSRLKDNGLKDYTESLKARGEKKDFQRLREEFVQRNKLDFDLKESAYVMEGGLSGYLSMMFLAQVYAAFNRLTIGRRVIEVIQEVTKSTIHPIDQIETIHNFISFQDGYIRKGAIASYKGQRMIIPFNMRDGLLICEGKSNPEWNYSAPHGAGRVLSRSQAKSKISMEEYQESMKGIFTTSVAKGTLDESPMAYKDAATIEAAIAPTATIIHRVKPIYNVKAGGD